MGLRIATNIAAVASRRSLAQATGKQVKSYTRLSSGQRITTAGDDAAGLSISENLRAQLRSMRQAERNANDGISLVQVAEGGLNEAGNILIRMRELAIQAASDTIGDDERRFIDQEVQSLILEVDRIADVTNFNGTQLLNGEAEKDELEFQVDIRNDEADRIVFDVTESNVKADELGIDALNAETTEDAREMLEVVDESLGKILETRARFGAMSNKLSSTVNNLQITQENLSAAKSRIADTDVAEETSNLMRDSILQQAGTAMLAQANASQSQALKLL